MTDHPTGPAASFAAEVPSWPSQIIDRLTEPLTTLRPYSDDEPDGVIYLDDHATTQPAPEVVHAMHRALTSFWANPSSTHRLGQLARQRVELAREAVARLINAKPGEIVFTSGGTEALKMAIHGVVRRRASVPGDDGGSVGAAGARPVVVTTPVEHSAVRALVEELERQDEAEVIRLEVDSAGVVRPSHLETVLRDVGARVRIVSVQWANNETGAIQPVRELLDLSRAITPRAIFHTDATQWVGKMPTDVRALPVDLLNFAAHKFHGPKGVGGLYIRSGVRIAPQVIGGSQERNRRGGTENVPGIVGMGVAAALAARDLSEDLAPIASGDPTQAQACSRHRVTALRNHFERCLVAAIPETSVNAGSATYGRLWSVSNMAFSRLEAEAVLMTLSERGVCASGGSACSSGSLEPSPVLQAMGLPEADAHGSVRFSFSRQVDRACLDAAVARIVPAVLLLRETLPVRRV